MTAHSEIRHVAYTPRQMFDLVENVEAYPEFLPWIAKARVRRTGGTSFEADLVVAFKVFRESYTSRVETFPPDSHDPARIDVRAIDGPFERLVTRYAFAEAEDGGCRMSFAVEFAFRNRLLQKVAGAAFALAMKKVAAAFEARAEQLYGERDEAERAISSGP